MSSTPGVQKLLDAEKRASEIVKQAKAERVQKLKEAQSEAMTEVEKTRSQKQAEYDSMAAKRKSEESGEKKTIADAADAEVATLKGHFTSHREAVAAIVFDIITHTAPVAQE